ncbi:serine hydrolase domain-containing protein [Nocardia terpenica]|uniref:serine hydrolase domain-containing protein n=1 Tax=Nocardia terpenica TaxID=455432 RepID=UPI0012E97981|nr:serine hydrolase domain-containing protein [Nocardia terpenica]NQE93817.1 beta-lactamase family protein [Nocardia terpenica]
MTENTDPRPSTTDLRFALERFREMGQLPGLAAAVWRGSTLLATAAVGVRKYDHPAPVTVGDCWHLGSDTKAMTATLIGLFVDRGIFRFEDCLGELLAGGPPCPGEAGLVGAAVHRDYAGVTVEQLLHHRGGTPENFPDDIWDLMASNNVEASVGRAEMVRAVLARPRAQVPGQFAYSNVGYIVLGMLLEQRCGISWESLIRTELFTALRMYSSGFGAPSASETSGQPWGHDSTLRPIPPGDPHSDNPPALGPAGTVHCTLADWGRFLAQHLAGARTEPAILTPTTMSRLHQPPPGGDYAAGWVVGNRDWADGRVLCHVGSNTLWTANAWLVPAKNLIFAVVTNRGDDQAQLITGDVISWLVDAYAMG